MPVKDVLVRAQELGGKWVAVGSDSARGIVVEDLTTDADDWGPRSCSFTLRRDPRVPWPDIGAFAPIEIESQGLLVWAGRVAGTPTTDGSDRRITVNGEGWQYHLDDDVYQKTYIHGRLTEYVDSRSLLGASLTNFSSGANVTVNDGVIILSFPNGAPQPAGVFCGVWLDYGEALCKKFFVNWESSNNAATVSFFCRGNDTPDGGFVAGDDAFSFALNSGAAGQSSGTFTTARRYINLFLNSAGAFTPAADIYFRISLATGFQDTAYESGQASILTASTVIQDARNKATLLLSASNDKISTTSFYIPELVMSKPSTPRDVINAVNAYHNYQTRVTVNKELEFRAQPASASIQVDARSEFDEASAGDASEVYSNVKVTYTDSAGQQQTVTRGQLATLSTVSAVQATNPGFEVNTTGWAAGYGTITRDVVIFDTGVASLKMAAGAGTIASASTAAWTGTWVAGRSYLLTFRFRASTATSFWQATIVDGNGSFVGSFACPIAARAPDGTVYAANTWYTATLYFTPQSSATPSFVVSVTDPTAGVNGYIDGLALTDSSTTVVDRRNFKRTYQLDTNMALTAAAAQQIGDVFLAAHRTTPLKGKILVTGHGTATKTPSGVSMPTAELLLNTGGIVRLAHLIDPDTGAIGREGRIASVTWDAQSDTATIEIDSQSTNFEAFLSRLGILTGAIK